MKKTLTDEQSKRVGIDFGSSAIKTVILTGMAVEQLPILPTLGQPLVQIKELLRQLAARFPNQKVKLGLTGAGAIKLAHSLNLASISETPAITVALDNYYKGTHTVIEMGHKHQTYLAFDQDQASGRLIMVDSNLGSKCAAGSGSFLEGMQKRLEFATMTDFAKTAFDVENPASLSGRCSVFTESDIVHLYQKGTSRDRIAAGVHQAICRNYRSSFARGKRFESDILFIGGVSENETVRKYLSEELSLNGSLIIPLYNRTLGAIGAAILADNEVDLNQTVQALDDVLRQPFEYASTPPLTFRQSVILPPPAETDIPLDIAMAALGVDIGSVSTKAALVAEVDGKLHVLATYYRKTAGDPLAAVRDTIGQIHNQIQTIGYRIGKIYAATTGSGRYLTGNYLGADLVVNEITAQGNGALAFTPDANTVLEIGGQDSKYIRIDGGVIVDNEMNKACAAGCGAFLEKQADCLHIPIEEFGDSALQATNPPDLDWTCTVFTEGSIEDYQQAGVSTADLCSAACLAAVRNYRHKIIGNREIAGNVVFQGAVAFNKGMIAAFETELGCQITVPPYPHLTGAIGAGRLALRGEYTSQPQFVGFAKIAEASYTVDSFGCLGCPNHCDVNTFQMADGPKHYFNDRCEKFSGRRKTKQGQGLPDLFAQREAKLHSFYYRQAPVGAPRVGIPRGLMHAEYFPLYNAFLTELGFQVVESDPSNKAIIDKGLTTSIGEPCFPYKAAQGHYVNLIENGVDYIFAPGIMSTEKDEHLRLSQTCPYLQAAPEIIDNCTGITANNIKFIGDRIHFIRGRQHLDRVFGEMAVELGKTAEEGIRALSIGLETLEKFRTWQADRGREVLESIGPHDVAFVVVGRPYSLYDSGVNMDIGKKIQDLGILAIPQDFLPIKETSIVDDWGDQYSRQIQKKLATARIIRKDPRLRAVVLTYFACGQDSFANPFFRAELGGEPSLMIQIDEHTADAGVITRIEAFADTIARKKPKLGTVVHVTQKSLGAIRKDGDKLWIPNATTSADILAAVFSAYGINAQVMPDVIDTTCEAARQLINEDVCLPALFTTQGMIERTRTHGFNSTGEAFFTGGSDGPCRFGMYYALQRLVLSRMGLPTPMTTISIKDESGGLGMHFALVAWGGFVAHDLLVKMLHSTRPYEKNPGACDVIFARHLKNLVALMPDYKQRVCGGFNKIRSLFGTGHLGELVNLLVAAQIDFQHVDLHHDLGTRPIIGVVGEWYVRNCAQANQDIIRKVEGLGGEVWLAAATEFFSYANYIGLVLRRQERSDGNNQLFKEIISRRINHHLAMRDEHYLYRASLPYLANYKDIGPEELIKRGSKYTDPAFGGETICSMGKADNLIEEFGVAGIISVIPFNCMPGNCVTALSEKLRQTHHNLPFLNLDYDGFVDSSRDAKIANFMWQVNERPRSGSKLLR